MQISMNIFESHFYKINTKFKSQGMKNSFGMNIIPPLFFFYINAFTHFMTSHRGPFQSLVV